MKRIQYQKNSVIGPANNIIFIKEVEPRYTPSGRKIRVGLFFDIDYQDFWQTDIQSITTGHTKHHPKNRANRAGKTKRDNNWKINEIKYIENYPIQLLKNLGKQADGKLYGEFKNLETGIIYQSSRNLVQQGKSLGLNGGSKGNNLIAKILKQLDINFYTEYIFKDCINPQTNRPLKFDFYLPDYNCCVEYDGEQHFKGWRKSTNVLESLHKIQYRDNIKNNYCENNKIKLVRIPYIDFNKINANYLLNKIK